MDQSWERQSFLRQEDNVELWDRESNTSDEESSIGEYEGTDLTMMPVNEVDLEELCCEFPRDELGTVLDGLNKFPWTVYPIHLRNCLSAAAKIVSGGREEFGGDFRKLQTLYREAVPSAFEKCLDDKAIWKWTNEIHNNIFDAVCKLMDLVSVKAPQLLLDDVGVDDDMLPLLRTLAIAFDKQCQFHLKHKEQGLPPSASSVSPPCNFARPMPGTPSRKASSNNDWHCANRKGAAVRDESCDCNRCRPPDVYCWLAYLLNYFGHTAYGNGYQHLLRVLNYPQKLLPAVMEALLLPIARSTEFITDEVASHLGDPCSRILRYVEDLLERDVDALSDKTKDGSFGALSLILKHLQVILGRSSSAEKAESMTSIVQRKMVERMLGFNSFNKQLSAVREINKLLENARAIAPRDKSRSVNATIQWLERNNILRHVLRSHLHHKQYVDQVEKIMRFLLQERRLSEEHIDAIWAATEKPDQFETVKANIFDLLADLAWSFSAEQLDSLFGRFERSQGRSPSDIVKILSLVKKLARSDTKGVMAQRLLELLWNMMHSGEAPAEVLDSGALTEILGHYDSVNCASKDEYISKCLKNVEHGISVIPSLRLLREIILLDNEKPFYQDEVSRQMRLQKLIKDDCFLLMVVKSLEQYMAHARLMCSEKLVVAKPSEKTAAPYSIADCRYTHDQHVKERLEFILFSIQAGDVSLPWDAMERLWNCMIESSVFDADKERGFQWLCDALEKTPCLSFDAMLNILTKKLTCMDPCSLSEIAWRCFMRLFLWVNLFEKKLVRIRIDEGTETHDLQLIGMSYMWQAALSSPVNSIAEQSISMLRDIHTHLSDSLRQNLVQIRQCFINECLRNLTAALENGHRNTEATDSNSISMVDGNVDVPDVENFTESIESEADKPCTVNFEKDPYKVERCLRILREFIIKCEGSCPRKVPAHGASFQGRPLTLGVSTANKQSTRFDILVHANEYLGSFRAKVAERLECPVSRVRLMHANKELKQDSQVLRQLGLTDGQPLTASVNIVDLVEEEMDELQLPGLLISKSPQVYDILFRLAEAGHGGVREEANYLLSLLPTHPGILSEFQNLHKKPVAKAKEFLTLQFGAHCRLLYTLQIVDGLLMPVNRNVENQRFRNDFIRFGGFRHLMTVFEPGAMMGVDSQTRRGCYTSALRILKLLLSETQTTSLSDNTRIIGGDTVEESESGSTISVNDDVNVEKLEVIDMSVVAGALKRLTWGTALGQISMLASSAPLAEILKGRRSEKKFENSGDFLNQDDRYLCLEALELLVTCLLSHKSLLGTFFSSPDVGRFIVDMVLHSPDEFVRYQAASSFLRLSKESGKHPIVRRHLMAALIDTKAEANTEPKRCLPFLELLGQLFYRISGPEEHAMGEQQLLEELSWLRCAPEATDDDDRLLEGHLFLVKVLIEVLDRRLIGSSKLPQGTGLVQELVESFLFLESAMLWKIDDDSCDRLDDRVLQSRCGTRRSREKAFQLLTCLATHCIDNLKEIVDLLVKLHFSSDIHEWEHLPSYGRKALSGYVGLKNAGATCYMNSVFQQLYMQPDVRRTVLECKECDDMEKADSVFFQLQTMFGALLGSSLDHYTPQGFWDAYRDYDGMPINLREHQDAFEFFNRLYDAVDDTLKATHQETTLTKIFGGIFVQQVISRGCNHCSERDEPFAAISVDVKNKRDLLESLDSFVRGDLLEADNAYYCDECGRKVDALKRVCVKSLPQTLVIHLKRFDFDYETMQRLKLKDRFEFPMHLDMKAFTVEGLALRDSMSQESSSPATTSNGGTDGSICNENGGLNSKPDSYYQYDLVGVVVHSGTAFAGHYYSYIKERQGDIERWIAFDDKRVEPYDVNDLEKDCFGGKYSVDVYDNFLKTMSPQDFDRPNSAYMLLYERSRNYAPMDSPATTSHTKGEGDQVMKDNSIMDRLFTGRLRMPSSIHRSVRKENLRFVHENHLLDKDYFKFLYSLVEANSDIIEGRTPRYVGGPDDSRDRKGETSGRKADLAAKDLNASDFAEHSIRIALEFLFRVYLRTHGSLREDFHQWKVVVTIWKLLDHNIIACRCFLNTLVERPQWVQDFLLRCPVEEVRQAFAALLVHALKTAVNIYQGNVFYVDNCGRQQDALHVDAMVDTLVILLREAASPKSYLQQYFQVLLDYVKLGPYPRLHLLRKAVVGHLVTFATKFQIAKQDAVYLHTAVSLLVRSCDASKLYDEPEVDKKSDTETKPCQSNPQQFCSLCLIPKDAAEGVFRHRMYTSILIKTCPEQEEVIRLVEFCSWRNETFSVAVLQDVMEALHHAVNSEALKPILSLAYRLLQLGDSLQATRQEVLLLGYESFPNGVLDLLVSKAVAVHKRYCLIKFIVKLVDLFPASRVHVLSRKQDWRRAVDWLQQELHGIGLSGSIAPVSNEDLSNGYLMRTSTAEWTLTSARKLLSC
ncbi:probable ubiquitin carboxyl-terminal hydrolase FAF-X isoform X1 [Selaginella moellendorffii]|uniref:probable ubiquitin carboxyl-terminal hydrolase FAF-X isoform X1 n=1 Tax=Selaginella moellendorffii TaxID=88036 RepID=UPI000D1C9D67|nr:probable ubiquitin carboxyl-terminal hydrolase FAF-X isoform X1 [Selaginella moellendorffii]|eukprot:XP_024517218.1 probable ubiquitin carboxyl-terminal hydrolase FAF-X isoform X1 [Selaginella moellendorffii]